MLAAWMHRVVSRQGFIHLSRLGAVVRAAVQLLTGGLAATWPGARSARDWAGD
jgi:hypothetical protein